MKHKTPSQYYLQFRLYNSDGRTLSSGSHISSNWNVFENNPSVLSALDSRKEALIFYDCCQILLPPTFNIFLEVHDIFISHDCRRILLPHTFNIFQRFMIRTPMVRTLWYWVSIRRYWLVLDGVGSV